MKYAWIKEQSDLFSVARMCRQLGVSRTGYCQWRTQPPSERSMANAALDARVGAVVVCVMAGPEILSLQNVLTT